MRKKKKKLCETSKRPDKKMIFWLGIVFLGIIVGLAVQFTRAWVEPSDTPPDGNIAAPINTGPGEQLKIGTAEDRADICVDPYGSGDKKCLSEQVSWPKCTLDGGIPVVAGGVTMCKFPGSSCGADWKPFLDYSETIANTCTGGGSCGTSVTSPFHKFENIDPATESAIYYDGNATTSYCQGACIDNCACWCAGYPGACTCCCGFAQNVCGSSCSSTARVCTSTQTAIGCVLI